MRSHVIRWLAIPALVAGMALPVPAWAQTTAPPSPQVPSIAVTPAYKSPNDPNNGQWFFIDGLLPGQTGQSGAKLTNPASIPQTVHLYLADLDFVADGGARLADEGKSVDIGSWGGFGANATVTLGPGETRVVPFGVSVPRDAEPGDHVGAVVAETAPQTTGDRNILSILRRVATRFYVTLPGEAHAAFSIQTIHMQKDSSLFTREITTTVVLHNDGRVRVRPTVLINGKQAKGSSVLLSNSIEPYFVTQKVPIWGGPVSARVEVHSMVGQADGPAREQTASTFVIPWVLLIGLGLLIGLFRLVRWLWRRRGGKYAAIQADLRRFERLLEHQRAAGDATADTAHDAELAIKEAIKQAGRAGDKETEIKLRGKLAELREQEAAPSPPPSASSPAPTSASPEAPSVEGQPAPSLEAQPAPSVEELTAELVDKLAPELGGVPVLKSVGAPAREPLVPPSVEPIVMPAAEPVALLEPNGNDVSVGNGTGHVENGANGNGHAGNRHAREDDASLVAILQVLAAAPPGGQRFALIKAARRYGREALEAHAEQLAELPEDVRVRLLRTAPTSTEIA